MEPEAVQHKLTLTWGGWGGKKHLPLLQSASLQSCADGSHSPLQGGTYWRAGVQGQPELHREFLGSLGHRRMSQKTEGVGRERRKENSQPHREVSAIKGWDGRIT